MRSFLDRNPVTGTRGSLFYRSYDRGSPAYRCWRYGIEHSWGRDTLRTIGEFLSWIHWRLKPPLIQTPEGAVSRTETVRSFIRDLSSLDDLPAFDTGPGSNHDTHAHA
mgnify:CR=1 FL=1